MVKLFWGWVMSGIKVRVMQNYSTSYFFFKHAFLDSVFNADYEYLLIFSI
jgi:hypothetical protein